jgi:hypothetical protein
MRRILVPIVSFALLVGFSHPSGFGEDPQNVTELMRKKLKHAQAVLEGIAVNDFDKIAQSSDELMLISKAAEWRVVKTPDYDLHSNSFRRACESLKEKAKEKNLDGAALAYVDLTLSCVRCHKYVRDTRMTRLDRR